MEQQLDAAVHAALSPSSSQELRQQAYSFLEQVRENKLETWSACLSLFLSGTEDAGTGKWAWKYEQQSRVFGLTIIDEVLLGSFDKLSAEHVETIRQGILGYAQREYVLGDAEQGSSYAKNKVARTVFCLFLNTYATTWQSFFADFAALVRAHPPSAASTSTSPALNPKATDLFLRILHEIAFEISDTQLRLNKGFERLNKDTELRDLIRVNAASGLSTLLFEILRDALAAVNLPADGQNSAAGRVDLVEYAARAIGDYVSWIDINLVINPHTIPLLFQCLQAPQLSIVAAAVEALGETVAKGMPAADKFELIRVLNVVEVVHQLQEAAYARSTELDEEVALRLKLARLLNGAGLELTKIATDNALDQERKQAAFATAHQLLPFALHFLRDADSTVSAAAIPFLTSVLQDFKKQKKAAGPRPAPFGEAQTAFLRELLEIVIRKMDFAEDAEWNGVSDDNGTDDNAPFLDMRAAMKNIFDAVAFIDEPLFASTVKPNISNVFDAISAGPQALQSMPWQRLELALHLLWLYGEADKTRGAGMASLVEVPKADLDKAKRDPKIHIQWHSYPAAPLGNFLLQAVKSPIASHPHPAVPLQFFECIVRYHDLFTLAPDVIPTVFAAFVGERGLHHPEEAVQQRTCYLFSRFVSASKSQIQAHCTIDMIKGVFSALQDLLVIKVVIDQKNLAAPDPLVKAAHSQSSFDSQVFIFEAVGQMISALQQSPEQQSASLRSIIDPLIAEARSRVRTSVTSVKDFEAILGLHHHIIAVGSLCKGFPNLTAKHETAQGSWSAIFVEAMGSILEALGVMSAISIIREAVRPLSHPSVKVLQNAQTISSFKIVVNTTGTAVLPLVPTLINLVLDKLQATEVVDFLPFVALLMHKYKSDFMPLLDTIIHPILARVAHFLSQPVTGTDDRVLHSDLRRAFYTLVTNIVNANQQDVFLSERNQPHFEGFLRNIVDWLTAEAMVSDIRSGFGTINRLASAWVPPTNGSTDTAVLTVSGESRPVKPVPGFERFIYDNVMPLCIDMPIQKSFDYSDGQTYLILGEMTTLMKTLFNRRGAEFSTFLAELLKAKQFPQDQAEKLVQEVAGRSDWHELKKFYAVRSSPLVRDGNAEDAQPFIQDMRGRRLSALAQAAA